MAVFQAEIRPARVFKQIVDALKEVVGEVHFECSDQHILAQAMDSSHVSLVSLRLNADRFQSYRCEKSVTLGVNVGSLAKVLRCGGNDDTIRLSADEDGDTLRVQLSDQSGDRVSDFSMKLVTIEGDSLGIPQLEFKAMVELPSTEYARLVKDIANLGDTVTVEVTKSAFTFASSGGIGSARLQVRATRGGIAAPVEKKEKTEAQVKREPGTESPRAGGRKRRVADDDGADDSKRRRKDTVRIDCHEPVTLQFALRYLGMFAKAAGISDSVRLRMAPNNPLQVEFDIDGGREGSLGVLRYYLAPKADACDEDGGAADEEAAGDD
eukprot:TRINITY_DN30474_c0_g1_i1.p1 TRINITY_DN30474_c0_g1~~TRINITY_DN30474_c0_g1_i1.p1  ORF type:complete len:348 (+),score=127.50 TRINITY_DN30474_c0_g1_i1:74-1045(+)